MTIEKILITGITGQDGIFLSTSLLKTSSNIEIYGTSRSLNNNQFFQKVENLVGKEHSRKISLQSIDLLNSRNVKNFLLANKFSKIVHLSGPSSVYKSYRDPTMYKDSIIKQFDNLIEGCIDTNMYPTFFQASSSEMFSSQAGLPLNEDSEMLPRSPYAEAKLTIHNKIQDLKNVNNWNIKSGIMFNHESEFRPNEFLIMKIIDAAISIKNGSAEKLTLGSLEYSRDWTYASDMADAIIEIINEMEPVDYVIGSGTSQSILDIVKIVFQYFDLEFDDYLEIDNTLLRKGDPIHIQSDPKLIFNRLNWKAKLSLEVMIDKIISSRLN